MRIVVAMDSFKGCMRSDEAGRIVADVLAEILPNAEIIVFPMADGGEGTAEVIHLAVGGERRFVSVVGPLGEEVEAFYVLLPGGRAAVIDMASASGIELVERHRRNPMEATSFGTGELIRAALAEDVQEIVLGIGGSATVDGGLGMAQALGFRPLDAEGKACGLGGQALAKVVSIDTETVVSDLSKCRIRVACDVTNPLLGERGAARVFGPQKGATPEMVAQLDAGLANLADVWIGESFLESVGRPGDGAAGGLGAALRAFCKAEICPGATLVAELTGFGQAVVGADVLITGEGRTDHQTMDGKLCWRLAELAKTAGARSILVSGAIAGTIEGLDRVFDATYATVDEICPADEAIGHGRQNLEEAARLAASDLAASQS